MILTKSAASGGISIPTAGEGEGDAHHISGDTHHRRDDAQHRPVEEQVGI